MRNVFITLLSLLLLTYNSYAANQVYDIDTQKQLIQTDKTKKSIKADNSAVDVVEQYEGESIVAGNTFDVGKTLLKITHADKVKPPFFDGIDNNVIFSQAMLNTQQQTGDPEFILLSRQNGLLKDNYLYLGGMASFNPTWGKYTRNNIPSNSINNYSLEYYMLSTLGEWTSIFASLNTYAIDGQWSATPGGVYFILGNLNKLPVYTYAALSTVNFGNFDETTNFIPTLTRTYFMQSGGNVNLSYNKDGLQANFVFLASPKSSLLQVANAYNGNAKLGFSVNMKYTKDLQNVGDYWYLGAAYSNVSGFTNEHNDNIGVADFNFGMNINKFEFINEFVFTDKGVTKTTNLSGGFNLREAFATAIFPDLNTNQFLTSGGNVFGWSSQLDYTANLYNKDFVPFVSYSQIQQASDNYSAAITSGFRYNIFADGWLGFSYTYIKGQAKSFAQQDNIMAMYLRIFI
ncbi:hypothetical protein [Francisella tularensis]|nr:hypothetical protein [Francisella tularensis]AEE87392.1 hypothetical protein FNFX1_1006 [Francisella cf. novicida Fx1]AJI44566.1 hypothetical protein AS84_1557 [Francisella tularensis subsp. novicida F6168]AJJ46798.1 hypothetical protein CH70_977 [Francisella tularensis subsp. novicida]AJJ47170.1 hypothetical protein CH70_1032 [Francisella tularensis subsp. novicida]APC99197.1 hypothetical protein KX03_999 [Francisella tularensis subsp. novicida]